MLLLFFVQDIAHIDGGYSPSNLNVLTYFLLAGFEVTIIGRIWVTAEDLRENPFSDYQFFLSPKGAQWAAERGHLASPKKYVQKTSINLIQHDKEITDFHILLDKHFPDPLWRQLKGELEMEFKDIPDGLFDIYDGMGWCPYENHRANETDYEKGKSSFERKMMYYDKTFKRSYIVMPTNKRVEAFLDKLCQYLPSSKLWFTTDELFRKDFTGKIWVTPKNYTERAYSILKPEI